MIIDDQPAMVDVDIHDLPGTRAMSRNPVQLRREGNRDAWGPWRRSS